MEILKFIKPGFSTVTLSKRLLSALSNTIDISFASSKGFNFKAFAFIKAKFVEKSPWSGLLGIDRTSLEISSSVNWLLLLSDNEILILSSIKLRFIKLTYPYLLK